MANEPRNSAKMFPFNSSTVFQTIIIVKAPNSMLKILDDFVDDLDNISITNLSIPIAKRAIANSVVINPAATKIFEITKPEIITETIPRDICRIRNPEGFLSIRS